MFGSTIEYSWRVPDDWKRVLHARLAAVSNRHLRCAMEELIRKHDEKALAFWLVQQFLEPNPEGGDEAATPAIFEWLAKISESHGAWTVEAAFNDARLADHDPIAMSMRLSAAIAELRALEVLTLRGWNVQEVARDSSRTDWIAKKEGKLASIEVKLKSPPDTMLNLIATAFRGLAVLPGMDAIANHKFYWDLADGTRDKDVQSLTALLYDEKAALVQSLALEREILEPTLIAKGRGGELFIQYSIDGSQEYRYVPRGSVDHSIKLLVTANDHPGFLVISGDYSGWMEDPSAQDLADRIGSLAKTLITQRVANRSEGRVFMMFWSVPFNWQSQQSEKLAEATNRVEIWSRRLPFILVPLQPFGGATSPDWFPNDLARDLL